MPVRLNLATLLSRAEVNRPLVVQLVQNVFPSFWVAQSPPPQ